MIKLLKMLKLTPLLFVIILLHACQNKTRVTHITTPTFNADSAYHHINKQVNFGPRVPNTKEHKLCAHYLANELKRYGAHVIEQQAEATAFDGTKLHITNIIGEYNPDAEGRILLFAHWDTRPFADHDPNLSLYNTPIDGANDGASGVGVLLEIARLIGINDHNLGVDIIFFDAEDYGQPNNSSFHQQEDTWCLGSQYWAKNPHKANYHAQYGILLDMVGAKDATFYQEGFSMEMAPQLVNQMWMQGLTNGYSNYFRLERSGKITDDHLYVGAIRKIPCVNIIQQSKDKNGDLSFGKYWHTHDDTMDNISRKTLFVVGHTVLETIYKH